MLVVALAVFAWIVVVPSCSTEFGCETSNYGDVHVITGDGQLAG